ncbi:hypothetical protein H5410_034888 [Solanum commersonii]|uniref:Uncharacterized protein n=1 Tax=Solanum commersonii TaxID=4109 RepID=A0A9J5Y287_SOLCO|nr:hypothetical protein H5410_034888 [Solanum commersonii]
MIINFCLKWVSICPSNSFFQLLFNASAGSLIVATGAGGSNGAENNWTALKEAMMIFANPWRGYVWYEGKCYRELRYKKRKTQKGMNEVFMPFSSSFQLLFNAIAGALNVAGGAGGSYGGEYNRTVIRPVSWWGMLVYAAMAWLTLFLLDLNTDLSLNLALLFEMGFYAFQLFFFLFSNASAGALIVASGAGGSNGAEYNRMA